jgi:ribosomal protein S19E (S16A)
MEQSPALKLSSSERQTLRHIAEGELHASELDWVAAQRLKTMGLIEERDRETMLTSEGQRTLGRMAGSS